MQMIDEQETAEKNYGKSEIFFSLVVLIEYFLQIYHYLKNLNNVLKVLAKHHVSIDLLYVDHI